MQRVAKMAACGMGAVMLAPAFVPGTSGPQMRGTAGGLTRTVATEAQAPVSQGQSSSNTSGCLVLGIASFAAGAALRRRQAEKIQAKAGAGGDDLVPGGPIAAYAQALADGAAANKESVPVTKDVLKAKEMYENQDFLDDLYGINGNPKLDDLQKAAGLCKLMKFESQVMPKFVTYLAKKKRFKSFKAIVTHYMKSQYVENSIAPVTVTSAQKLSEEQVQTIKDKMKAKTGCKDVKLIVQQDAGLLAGLKIEWGYVDPVLLDAPSEGIDFSLKTYLVKKALLQGVATPDFS